MPAVPATGNRHAYALGDPLRWADPSGRFVAALWGMPGGLLEALGLEGPSVAPTTGTSPMCYDIRVACSNGFPLPWEYQPHPGGGLDLGGLLDVGLDAVGFFPVIGDAVDLGRAAVDLGRFVATGDPDALFQAGLNATAALPGAGSFLKQGAKHIDEAADIVTGAARVERRAADIAGARFAQRSYSEKFGPAGLFAGRTIDDVADALRAGTMSPSEVPINVVVRDGTTLIANTRSAQALTRAGIPRGEWNVVDRTGDALHERLVSGQLGRNNLDSTGIDLP